MPDERPSLHDLPIAASLLTRVPVPVDHTRAGARMAVALWAAPVVGAGVGLATGAALAGGLAAGLPPMGAAILATGVALLLTGALHEDGLADCADGFGGGHTVERRLEIMRDSRLGTFGVAALVLALMLRVVLLGALDADRALLACAVAGAVSRVPMVWALVLLPPVRAGGLGARAGRPPLWVPGLALALAAAIAVMLPAGLAALAAAALAATGLGLAARRAIGGQTGDVLGGMQVVAELGALVALVAMAGR